MALTLPPYDATSKPCPPPQTLHDHEANGNAPAPGRATGNTYLHSKSNFTNNIYWSHLASQIIFLKTHISIIPAFQLLVCLQLIFFGASKSLEKRRQPTRQYRDVFLTILISTHIREDVTQVHSGGSNHDPWEPSLYHKEVN